MTTAKRSSYRIRTPGLRPATAARARAVSASGGKGGKGGSAGQSQGGAAGEAQGGASGEAGAGGVSGEAGMGGVAIGGEGGAGGASCGTPVINGHTCAMITAGWDPRLDAATGEFRFDVSSLGGDIVNGFATYFGWNFDSGSGSWLMDTCGQLNDTNFQVDGSDVVFSTGGPITSERVTINYLSLTDACGDEHNFVLNGVECFLLEFLSVDGGTQWQVGCQGGDCDAQCV